MRLHYKDGYDFDSWWHNFVDSLDMTCPETIEEKTTFIIKRHRCIFRELSKIGISWHPGQYYIDFKDEATATWFLLKWS